MAGQLVYMPGTSRLEMGAKGDLLSLAYNTFFSELEVPVPSQSSLPFRFWISGRGWPGEDLPKPKAGLDHAVGALSVPLQPTPRPGRYVRPREQEIHPSW